MSIGGFRFLYKSIQADTMILFSMLGLGMGMGVWTGVRKITCDQDLRLRKDWGVPAEDRWSQLLNNTNEKH